MTTTVGVAAGSGVPARTPGLLLSTACLAGTLEDKLVAASAAGFGGIELLDSDLVTSTWAPEEIRAEAATRGLTVEVFQPLHVEALPPDEFPGLLRRADRKLALVEELGASVLVLCSSRSPRGVDDQDLAVEQLRALGERAAHHGVKLAYEAVPWGRVDTHAHAASLVRRADHANVGLCLDTFHVLSHGHGSYAEGLDQVVHVQLADAPRLALDTREWSLHYRMFPGQGSLDLAGIVRRVLASGYDGPIALEVFNDVYQQEDPRHAATDAMRSVLALDESVRPGDRPGVSLSVGPALPPPPDLQGVAFAELAVDQVSGPLLARVLSDLGFVHSAQHRSKPVQLWEQGAARILLNSAPQRSVDSASAAVHALGIECPDPERLALRAERLLAPTLPRRREADEADLSSVAAPDGTALFFCDSGRAGGWVDDFVATGEQAPSTPWLSAVDHVSLTESVDDFDQAALFYRCLLGLDPGESVEVTAPFGLLRRWSAAEPGRRLRIGLSTAPLRRGDWAPGVSSPQHVAFVTGDVLGCAAAARDRGATLLEVPGNYYDDLESRYDLPARLVDDLRQHSVLYDRDDRGEYLHFFTEIVGSRIFFEVVQRIDGYDGTGASEAVSLRIAAHRRQRLRVLGGALSESTTETQRDYSLAHLTALSLSPPELVEAAAEAGYRYVGLRLTKVTMEEPHYPLAYDPALMRATRTHLAATGVEVLDVELARLTSGDDPRDYVRFLETGAELGARHVITQLPDADFSRKVARFAELCELAHPFGLTIDLEFPSWTETPDLGEATRVLRAADQPNAGMLVDLLHFARSGSSVSDLRELPRHWFHYAHVCDAPADVPTTTQGLIHTARFERLFPGEGGIDAHAVLGALPSGIPYALEIPRATLVAQVGAKEHARQAIAAARRHLDGVVASADWQADV